MENEEFSIQQKAQSILSDLAIALSKLPVTAPLALYQVWPTEVLDALKEADSAIAFLFETREAELKAAYDEAANAIGELHLQQIENWEGEVKEQEARANRLALKLADLQPQLEELETVKGQLEGARIGRDEAQALAGKNYDNGRMWEKEAKELGKTIDGLQGQLHSMTIENAELRGYQRRVNQFDPLSDRDMAEREDRPIGPISRRSSVDGMASEFSRHALAPKDDRPSWYRRR